MSTDNEFAAQEGAEAVAPESVPEQQVEESVTPVEQEAATPENPSEEQGSEPSVPVKELIAQRKKRQKAEQEAAYWRGQAEARAVQEQQVKPPVQQQAQQGPPQAPKLDDFETFEQYEQAKDEYVIQAAEYRIAQKIAQQQQVVRTRSVEQAFEQKFEAAAKEDPSLIEIRNDPTLPVSPVLGKLIQQSDDGIAVLRWLNNNREAAAKISKLEPMRAAIEFGRIEATIQGTPKQEQPRKVSAAPTPISTVKTTAPATINEDDLPMEEYYKRRTKAVYGR